MIFSQRSDHALRRARKRPRVTSLVGCTLSCQRLSGTYGRLLSVIHAIDVMRDKAHRQLAEAMMGTALEASGLTVDNISWGATYDGDRSYSWLCYIADPRAENRVASLSERSAKDHLIHIDPNGLVTRNVGATIRVHVLELETSDVAAFTLLDPDGSERLVSPWQLDEVVARVTFHYDVV